MGFLKKWLTAQDRQPLVIRGARQVGKTWVVRHLAESEGRELVELNLEKNPAYARLFSSNDPKLIVEKMRQRFRVELDPKKSILFLDEIQEKPDLYAALRWFYEEMPELPVIAAGSLLEFVLKKVEMSMPVGRVEFMYLEPISFIEFLNAYGYTDLEELIRTFTWDDSIDEDIHGELMKLFKEYVFTGGMPRAVSHWVTQRSVESITKIHNNLIGAYRTDFNKYGKKIPQGILDEVMKTVSLSLGNKFVYAKVNTSERTETIKNALELLCDARVCHKVESTDANGVPLGAKLKLGYFKVILLDVGLCSSLLGLTLDTLQDVEELDLVNKGGIAEQVAGQLLRTINPPYIEPRLYYWLRPSRKAGAELDYVIQYKNRVFPVEVKAGRTGTLKSLHLFMDLKGFPQAIRINSAVPLQSQISIKKSEEESIEYKLNSLPFYLISEIHRLVE